MEHRNYKIVAGMFVSAAIFLTSCNRAQPAIPAPAETVSDIASPAGPDSGQPNLTVGPDGATYLSWIETADDGSPELKFAIRKDEKWSPTQSIIRNESLIVNYADFPSLLSLGGGLLAAHWMTSIPRSEEGYRINIAFSRDDGHTWSKPVVPHRDSTRTEHGFVSMTPTPDGGIGAIWLDSRKLAKSGESGDVAMMYTSVGQDGKLGPEMTIDGRVCECCQPSSVRTSNGVLTAFRDRSEKEIRDIAVVRFDGTKWSEPQNVFHDMWEINGCPINGPAIASRDSQVAVAWFTAPGGKPKVQVAFSTDGANSFADPVRVDEGNPIGRVGVVLLDSGSAVVTWLERDAKGSQLRARRIEKNGTKHPSLLVGNTSAGTSGGFPRVGRSGNNVMFAWTDTNEGRVRVSVLNANN